MPEWFNTPLIIIAVLAVGRLLWSTATWKLGVDKDRKSAKIAADADRKAWEQRADRDLAEWKESVEQERSALRDFMSEIRDDIKKIFARLPPTPAPVESASPLRLTDFGRQIEANRLLAYHQW